MQLYPQKIGARRRAPLIALTILALACLCRAQSFTDSIQFPGGGSRADVSLVGSAKTVGDAVQLTDAVAYQAGTLIISSIPSGELVKRLKVKFEVQTTGGTAPPADGYSFNFGPELFGSTIGEDGIASGLSVTFDTFDNGGNDTAPAAEVVYDGVVKKGVSFSGTRQSNRSAAYAAYATDASGNAMSLTSGDTFVPVEIELSTPTVNGGGVVTVTYKGRTIMQNVAVPFSPAKGWRIGFGARTGDKTEKQSVRNISIEADTSVGVVVNSAYGETLLSPAPGSKTYQGGQSVTFDAPDYVYLDRYRKTLYGTPEYVQRLAAYRARRVGGTMNGQTLQPGATIKLLEDKVVNWQWELEYLAEVNTGTETIQGLTASSVTDAPNQPTLGRNFRTPGYNFNSVVFSQIMGTGNGLDIQFQPKGYVVENAPDAPERFLQLSGGGDYLRAESAGTGLLGTDGSFTMEFWARRDPLTMTTDQNVVALGSSIASSGQLRAGFTAGNACFLTDNGVSIVAPASMTDNGWHHWAAVNDKTANTVTLYRDGKIVASGNQALSFSGSTQIVCVGARANGSNAEGFFPGGINNVRVWKTALNIDQVRSARSTVLVGTGNVSLGLELPFDTLPADISGVYLERRKGTLPPSSVADTESFPVELHATQSGFTLPSVPAGYYGWTLRSRLRIQTAANYTFHFHPGHGGRLLIDGVRMLNSDGRNDEALEVNVSRFLAAGDHIIEMDVYDPGETSSQALSLTYESAEASVAKQALPSANLRVLARDHLTLGGFALASTEGASVPFSAKGFDAVIPAGASGGEMVAAVLPGFHFNPLDTTTGTTHNIDPTEQGALTDYRRVFWMWDKKFRFKVDVAAVGLPDAALAAAAKSPYFKMVDGFLDDSNSVKKQVAAGILTVLDLWLAEGEKLEVGAIYRSADRRYTLSEVSQAMNNFANIDFRAMDNGSYNGQAAKSYSIAGVSAPGSMMLTFAPTTFRAQLAIGQGLDFSSRDAIDTQLTPDLPDDAVLVSVTANSQPAVTAPDVTQDEPGWTAGEGDSWQWDIVGKKWYPLKPGVFTLAWKDKNTGEIYHMEVTAGLPADTRTIAYLEDDRGNYLGSAPDYQTDFTFAATAGSFPAAPGAHYRYLAVNDSPLPVDLDPSATDRWSFLRKAFSTQSTAKVDKTSASGPRFAETTADARTVLVFSYRPTNAVASGDLNRERIAVRVVDSLDPETHSNDGPAQTVASRITSTDDTAGYGSGYIVNEVSNYNASVYDRSAAVGEWGPVYPVNWDGLFTDKKRLSIGYYENPGQDSASTVHPPVGWPYVLTHYDDVDFPDPDSASTPVIYIASQLGSEGVDQSLDTPQPQRVFEPTQFANLTVYNQPDRKLPGFNPNEEHALVAPSNLAVMTGDDLKDVGQSAFFALQQFINRTDEGSLSTYTSEPFVLAQYTHVATGQPGMIAYRVLTTRGSENDGITTPFPNRDPKTHLPVDEEGKPVPQPVNPRYEFSTVTFAGDGVTPIYPLNIVMGGRNLTQNQKKGLDVSIWINGGSESFVQQTLWHDKNGNPWAVAGDFEDAQHARHAGRFNHGFWYPLAEGFWLGEDNIANGTPVCWLPDTAENASLSEFTDKNSVPRDISYSSYWKENYPVLKRGETLAYAGGEYKADHPAAPGLPAVISWASGEVAFDSATPDMAINDDDLERFNARFMRLLEVRSVDYTKEQMPEGLTPQHADKVSVSGARWYFKDLGGSLSQLFYYDSLAAKLVLRGSVNGRESGDPALGTPPLTATQILPNVLTEGDVTKLKSLASGNTEWAEAIESLFQQSNPVGYAESKNAALTHAPLGLRFAASGENQIKFLKNDGTEDLVATKYRSLKSLGTGTMLVPNPELLTEAAGEERFVTLVENNDEKAGGAVTLHVIRLGDERYRGSISVITPKDAFDEKVELTHSGDFGGAVDKIYYQWWVHDVAPLDGLATPDQSTSGWSIYQQGRGLNRIQFTGRPDLTLADKLFYVRYGHADELGDVTGQANTIPDDPETNPSSVTSASWRLVDPDANAPDWGRSNPDGKLPPSGPDGGAVPYQWAGAANSPQLQASGSRRFLPQLLMGWVKRVLDAVNPYEARYSAEFNGDAPPTGSSMLGQAGRPYNGPVALNSSRDAIENVGLIELYETVLQRAKDLSGNTNDPGINQALLLASTRLAMLYELLAGEAYTDAQNSSLSLTTADTDNAGLNFTELAAANPYVFAFMNEVPSLLQEELALLRGTDYLKSYPCQNRLFWNYFKGIGEAAYNANYGIGDVNRDGLIDETDAALTYPMGHGDAWGHFLSASKMHYGLLRRSNYDWQARAELYSLLGNVIPTDYLDEQSFARTAATKARCGLSIVKATYRDAYNANPATQWQGYDDTADPARAWGVSEWAKRAGQGAVFDWMAGNAILPAGSTDPATGKPLEGLNLINRQTAKADLQALAGSLREIQQALDAANHGLTPIGVDPDAVSFGLDSFYDLTWERKTHFEQTYESAVAAAANAKAALDFVSSTSQTMRQIGNDAGALKQKAIEQDIDYRNRLIALLGTPYSGAIGAGQIFQEGYTGPDTVTYMYLDATTIRHVEPEAHTSDHLAAAFRTARTMIQKSVTETGSELDFGSIGWENPDGKDLRSLFDKFHLSEATQNQYPRIIINGISEDTEGVEVSNMLSVDVPVSLTSQYAFKAPEEWGQRAATGEIQSALGDMLRNEIALETAIDDYQVYVNKLSNLAEYADRRLASLDGAQISRQDYLGLIMAANLVKGVNEYVHKQSEHGIKWTDWASSGPEAGARLEPNVVGGNVPFAPLDIVIQAGKFVAKNALAVIAGGSESAAAAAEALAKELELLKEKDAEVYSEFNELLELVKELSNELQEEPSKRLNMAAAVQNLNMAAAKVRSLEAEANRLIAERAAMNKMIAGRAQANRYGDMIARLSRDDAARKYESAMDTAVRFAWLAAKAYDYETSLSPGHPANAVTVLEDLMKVRQLGQWDGDTPKVGNGGLAEILAKLKANYDGLKGSIGLNNPQGEASTLSLRTEAKRILADGSSSSNQKWQSYLASTQVADLNRDPDFTRRCRPFASPAGPAQPGFKIEFSSEINSGRNFFGNALSAADHAYSSANFATKLRSVGVGFSGYDVAADGQQKLAATPRVYLVPAGTDIMRYSDGLMPKTRGWNVVRQRIPVPFPINTTHLRDYAFNPAVDSLNGSFADLIRQGDFRAYPTSGGALSGSDPAYTDTQLFSRSVWNTRWILFIPAASLGSDPQAAMQRFIDTVDDIQLQLTTFSSSGM